MHADVAGSGSADLGRIANGLNLDIAGSGDFNATSVNGPVHVDIVGAGSVNIPQGTADPLHVDIMGAGNFVFGGEAVDPHISALGLGQREAAFLQGQAVVGRNGRCEDRPRRLPGPARRLPHLGTACAARTEEALNKFRRSP